MSSARAAGLLALPLVVASSLTGLVLMGAAIPTSAAGGAGASDHAVADIPPPLLAAYQGAAGRCPGLSWTVLAAIGKVESDHGHFGGAVLQPDGLVSPPIIGPTLDGTNGTAAIADTDQGAWDGDDRWDHTVGPMQFIPSTWQQWGLDGNDDGVEDPHNAFDAIPTAADYLCGGADELGSVEDALLRYNQSQAYVDQVLAIAATYAAVAGVAGGPVACGDGPDPGALAPTALVAEVIADACAQLGDPYVWGAGRTDDPDPDAFDCSGLVWWAYNQSGVVLPYSADTQYDGIANRIPAGPGELGALLPGDLVFYNYGRLPPGNADHVSLYFGGGLVVEALNTSTPVGVRDITGDGNVIGAARPWNAL